MKVSAYRGEVCGERSGLFKKFHGASGVWVEQAWCVGRARSVGCARSVESARSLVAVEKKPRLACPSESIAATRGEFRIPPTEGPIAACSMID